MIRIQISGLLFLILYSFYSFFLFNFPLFTKFYNILKPSSIWDFVFLFNVLVVAFLECATFYLVIFGGRLLKPLAIFFLLLNSLVYYFIKEYGVPIDKGMILNTFSTDIREVRDLISYKMILNIALFGALPSFLVYISNVEKIKLLKKVKLFILSIIICFTLIASSYVRLSIFFRVNRDLQDFLIPFNYLNPLFMISKNKILSSKEEKKVEIDDLEVSLNSEINIVLIIGETARRANFELYGYERKTNPELSKIKNLKMLKGISCGTSTRISLPCIFTFKDSHESYLNSIYKAGVFVKWYENNYGGCYDMCDNIPTFRSDHSKCDGSCHDGVIFDKFYEDLKETANLNKPKLFVLHQNGSHGPLYFKRYPREFAKFTPECDTANVNLCSIESLINAYDNSILYTDFLIAQTIEKLTKTGKPSILIFASDHGESLGENGIFLHGFPYALAPKEQKEIPFVIWSSFPINISNKSEYIHKQIMQSVLHLLKADTKHADKNLNIIHVP